MFRRTWRQARYANFQLSVPDSKEDWRLGFSFGVLGLDGFIVLPVIRVFGASAMTAHRSGTFFQLICCRWSLGDPLLVHAPAFTSSCLCYLVPADPCFRSDGLAILNSPVAIPLLISCLDCVGRGRRLYHEESQGQALNCRQLRDRRASLSDGMGYPTAIPGRIDTIRS